MTILTQDLGASPWQVIEAPGHSMVRTMRPVQSMEVPPSQEAASSFLAKHYSGEHLLSAPSSCPHPSPHLWRQLHSRSSIPIASACPWHFAVADSSSASSAGSWWTLWGSGPAAEASSRITDKSAHHTEAAHWSGTTLDS